MQTDRRSDAAREHADWNERMVERYDIESYYRDAHPIVRWVERRRLDAIDRLTAKARAARVLEVGVGAGHVLSRIEGAATTGLDLSPGMLARARRRLGEGTPLVRGSADALPFADGSYDAVICTEVLEHTPDPGSVLRELVRVAGKGAVIVSVPNEAMIDRAKRLIARTPLLRSWLRTLAGEGNEWHLHDFDLPMLRRLATGVATIEMVIPVPGRLAPVRYVALLRGAVHTTASRRLAAAGSQP
jgi:ubiquinone/menaquinone biosynthesis C-methylase UbiE